ncbi:TPA: ATP-binding protein, partial [Shigella sonnei]
ANNIRHMLQSMKTCVVLATTTDRRNNRMSDNLLNKLTQLKLPAMAGSLIRQRETKWHGLMENPTTADAILDRLVHNSHRVVLQGESLRKNPPTVESSEKTS